MLKRFFVTVAAILAALTAGAALAVLPRTEPILSTAPRAASGSTAPESAAPSPAEEQPPSPSSQEAKGYVLGAFDGRVSVLSPDTGEPEMIFDIFLRTLPDADQQLLREGIRVETYSELTRLIEDYIS